METPKGRPEIKTPEAAQLVGGMVTDLYAKWLSASQEVDRLLAEVKANALARSESEKAFRQEIRERDLKIDDLSQREHTLQEKLDLERIESEAMRGELRHLRSTIEAAAVRVEGAVMREIEDRHDQNSRRNRPQADVTAIEAALLQEADKQNAANAEPASEEPQAQRLDMRPVEAEAPAFLQREPTRLPPEALEQALDAGRPAPPRPRGGKSEWE